jgi:hypothetical protein
MKYESCINVYKINENIGRLYLWGKAHFQNKLSEHATEDRSVDEVNTGVVTGNSVVEIGESTIGRSYVDPVCEIGVEHVPGGLACN